MFIASAPGLKLKLNRLNNEIYSVDLKTCCEIKLNFIGNKISIKLL